MQSNALEENYLSLRWLMNWSLQESDSISKNQHLAIQNLYTQAVHQEEQFFHDLGCNRTRAAQWFETLQQNFALIKKQESI